MPKTLADCVHFFWAGLRKQQQTGALFPSQKYLVDKMIAPVSENYDGEIIELGAGTGALTLRLVSKCPKARVVACEINPTLAADLRSNLDHAGINGRVKVVSDSAENLLSRWNARGKAKPDYVISGIPLGNVPKADTFALLDQVRSALAIGGMYIQFQHSLLDRKKIQARFTDLKTVPVLLNVPPAFIYYARK